MRLLELFSGTCSVSKEAERRGYEVRNIDIVGNPTYKQDILTWDYKTDLGDWKPDIIWASFPCEEFSPMKRVGHRTRDLEKGRSLMLRALEIIEEIKPKVFILENPVGLARHQPELKALPFRHTVTYCHYGRDYKKPTDLFCNIPLNLKYCKRDCGKIVPGTRSHIGRIGFGKRVNGAAPSLVNTNGHGVNVTATKSIQSIPTSLISSILDQIQGNS